jgi:hypothetical protein
MEIAEKIDRTHVLVDALKRCVTDTARLAAIEYDDAI